MLQKAVDMYVAALEAETSRPLGRGRRSTFVAYCSDLRQFCAFVEEQEGIDDWSQVSPELIATYIEELRREFFYRPATIERKKVVLRSFFRYLRVMGLLAQNPCERLESAVEPEGAPGVPRRLTSEQLVALFAQVNAGTPTGRRDLALLQLLCVAGMRVNDLGLLNVDDFDGEGAQISCNEGRHQLPLPPSVVEALQSYLESGRPYLVRQRLTEQALFLNRYGARLTRQGLWLIIKGYARRAGIGEITARTLQRSILKEGRGLYVLQELWEHIDAMEALASLPA